MSTYSLERIEDLSQAEFDQLPFGVIIVNSEGIVLRYNAYESKLSSLDIDYVVGKSFFDEIAPCTKVKDFYGRFTEGVKNRDLLASFCFIFKLTKTRKVVTITMFYNPETGNVTIRVDSIGA